MIIVLLNIFHMRMKKTSLVDCGFLIGIALCVSPVWAAEPVGIVAEPPAEGRSVKTDDGYMVAYTETIPGTNVVF